ncbi:MAG: DUF4867 family protein [Clostridia bacterium]|nr:DUF4867 family protein [Clostridia bacterium]
MLNILNNKNDYKIYSVTDKEFTSYGRIVKDIDAGEIIKVAKTIELPAEGSMYVASEPKFEALEIKHEIEDKLYGTLPTQIGYCWGHSNFLNAAEWHTSSEVNIAINDLVLFLAHTYEMEDGKIDSSAFKAFLVPAGTVIEVYATSLHFCPCEVSKDGFGCVVGLPTETNTNLEKTVNTPFLFRKNKWIVSHNDNGALIARGVQKGISGTNFELKY